MFKGQKSSTDGIENFLCPFTDMYISQGSNGAYSHKGIKAHDVRGKVAGVKYPYYAPCTCICIKTYPVTGQVMWQSINKVRFSNGRVDYATFMTCHDESMNAYPGMIINQGNQLGNMGRKGYSNMTGVHCHIEISQSKDTSWFKNKYDNYMFNKSMYNPREPLGNKTLKKIEEKSKNSNEVKDAVNYCISMNNNESFDDCVFENAEMSGDLYYSIQHVNIHVAGEKLSDDKWNIIIIMSDVYDFTENRDGHSLGVLANNLGYYMQKYGLLKEYAWSVAYGFEYEG